MRAVLSFDEIIAGVKVKAGTAVTATLDNADTLDALLQTFRAFSVPETTISPGRGNVQFAVIDQRARRPFRGIALSNGIVLAAAPANTPLAQIVTNDAGAIVLTNNAGGKVGLVGRYIVSTGVAIAAGDSLTVGITVNGTAREFTLVGAGATGSGTPTPTPTPSARRNVGSGSEDPSNTMTLGSGNVLIQWRTRVRIDNDVADIDYAEALFYVNNVSGQYADVPMSLPVGTVLNAALEVETAAAGTPSVGYVDYTFAGGGKTYTATGSETNWIDSQPVAASSFGLSKFTKTDVLWLRRAILFPAANATWLCNDASDASQPTSGEAVRVAVDNSYNKVSGTGVLTGTAGTTPALSRFLRPMAMRGVHTGTAIKLITDSIGHAKDNNRNGDGSSTTTPGGPYRRAAYIAGLSLQKSGRDGNFLSNITPAKAPVRFAQIAAGIYTHLWVTMGTNDLNNVPVATAIASLRAIVTNAKAAYPSIKVVADEILARVQDTQTNPDQFTTLAGQTVQGKDTAQQFGPNPTYGSGTDVLSGYRAGLAALLAEGVLSAITTANTGWADQSDGYKIRVNGTAFYWSKDGTHQTLVAALSTADALAPTLASKFANP